MKRFNWFFFSLILWIVALSSCDKNNEFDSDYFEDDFEYSDDFNSVDAEEEGLLTVYKINGDDISKIRDFEVDAKLISYQEDVTRHFEMWNFFSQLIPAQHRGRITEFLVFHGDGEFLGYVEPIDENDLSKWRMGLAIDVDANLQEVKLKNDFAYTSIHEFGHVQTLNERQIHVDGDFSACGTYHTGEGCAAPSAYINQLFNLGWKDIMTEYENISEEDYDAMEAFYDKYQDRFVSGYAATNPGEDMAEVFTFFVVEDGPRAGNTIADQKLNLLYESPELVKIRSDIRQNPVARTLHTRSWSRTDSRLQKRNTALGRRHQH